MSGIRTKYIELAINNEYMGIYALCEQLDKKQLQLEKYNTTIKGELYKGVSWGASTFTSLPPYDNNNFLDIYFSSTILKPMALKIIVPIQYLRLVHELYSYYLKTDAGLLIAVGAQTTKLFNASL